MRRLARIFAPLIVFCSLTGVLANSSSQSELRAMLDTDGIERRKAIWFVYQRNEHELLPYAAGFLFESDDERDHIAILNVMIAYGERLERYLPDWHVILDRYIDLDVPPEILEKCVQLAVYFQEERLRHALERLSHHPDRDVRMASFDALSRMGTDQLIPILLRLVHEERPVYRMYGLEGLLHYGDQRMIPFLSRAVDDESKSVRIFAITALGDHHAAAELSHHIAGRYNKEEDPEVRERILQMIGKHDWDRYGYIVQRGIADSSPVVRRAALVAARDMMDRSASIAISRQLIQEEELHLKLLAINALMTLRNSGQGQGLLHVLEDEADPVLRRRAALALGELKEPRGLFALMHAAKTDADQAVRVESCHALGRLGDDRAIDSLRVIAGDSTAPYEVQSAALLALVQLGSRRSNLALEELAAMSPELGQAIQKLRSRGR